MGEYASFHYLMHKVEDTAKPVYTVDRALNFNELYSPRERSVLYKGEKSYWRTRDRIEYTIIEDRPKKVIVITCRNMDGTQLYRTIFLNLEALYFELESKARDDRTPLTKKRDKKLDDSNLFKVASDYILARLMIQAEPLPWPDFASTTANQTTHVSENTSDDTLVQAVDSNFNTLKEEFVLKERMCTFEKLSSDANASLEIAPPLNASQDYGDLPNIKLSPTVVAVNETNNNSLSIPLVIDTASLSSSCTSIEMPTAAQGSGVSTNTSADNGKGTDQDVIKSSQKESVESAIAKPKKVAPATVSKGKSPPPNIKGNTRKVTPSG
jgi:hypothetical protein